MTTPTPPPKKNNLPAIFTRITTRAAGHRIVLYGPGGIGKSTLGCQMPGEVAYVDAEDSLEILKPRLEAKGIRLPAIATFRTWAELRAGLADLDQWDQFKSIVLEITRIEEWAMRHTLTTVKNEKGSLVQRIEDYGYGKGFQHIYDTFSLLFGDLDRHTRAGRNVLLIAHDCVKNVPNPKGDDWIRYEPRLQDQASGKASIRLRVKEWADHVLFFGYDVTIDEDGKARGSGSRAIYSKELPHFMAKSRTTEATIVVNETGSNVWNQIIK